MAVTKGNQPVVKVAATATPATVVGHMNNVSLSFNGSPVDVTEFAATPNQPLYIARAPGIKDVKCTMSGFLEKADAGQTILWANMVSDTDLFCKVLLTATTPAVEFKAVVESIDIKDTVQGYVEVTYNVSNAGTSAQVIIT